MSKMTRIKVIDDCEIHGLSITPKGIVPDITITKHHYEEIDLKIEVIGPCWTGNFDCECDCTKYNNADPERVGYPPFHEGCTCLVKKSEDKE